VPSLVLVTVPPCALPLFACRGGIFPGHFCFAFGFLQTLAGTLQLFLGDADTLLGDFGLQARSFYGLRRRIFFMRRFPREIFAACSFHA
jgi:hypothetical protein